MSTKAIAQIVLAVIVVALLGVSTALFGGSAAAQVDPYAERSPTTRPTVIGTDIHTAQPDGADDDDVLPQAEEPARLPLTGGDVVLYVATGLAAIGTGGLIVRSTRRRRTDGDADE